MAEKSFSRGTFLKRGGGGLAAGFSLLGGALAGNARAADGGGRVGRVPAPVVDSPQPAVGGATAAPATPSSPATSWVSLSSAGAAGDGVTDDTAKAQAVLSAARAGGVVVVPAGYTFLVSGLSVPDGVTLLFESKSARLRLKASSTAPVLTLNAGAKAVGGYIDGNRGEVASSQARGILLYGDGARVEGTEVANVYSYGIQVTDASDAYVDAYVHDTRDIGIFADCVARDAKRLKIRGKVDRVGEGQQIVGSGVQVWGTTFKYSNVDIDCDVLMPQSPADPTAVCISVNGRRGATVRSTTEGGQMGVTFDLIAGARVSTYVLGPSNYGIEFSNCPDFVAEAPVVDCNGVTTGAGIIANRGATGLIGDAVVNNPAAGAPCIHIHTSGDVGITNPRLTGSTQGDFIALTDSSRCQIVGGTMRDDYGARNGLVIFSQAQDASDNSLVGTTLYVPASGAMTALRILAFTNGKHADRNMVSAYTIVGNKHPSSQGAFMQAANGGVVAGTRLEQSNVSGITTKVRSLGATGAVVASAWA